jgi:hypothetical protein
VPRYFGRPGGCLWPHVIGGKALRVTSLHPPPSLLPIFAHSSHLIDASADLYIKKLLIESLNQRCTAGAELMFSVIPFLGS